jgi:hypothetical protein
MGVGGIVAAAGARGRHRTGHGHIGRDGHRHCCTLFAQQVDQEFLDLIDALCKGSLTVP